MAGYTPRQFTCPQAVTHPSSNRAQCRLTMLIEANAPCRHPYDVIRCLNLHIHKNMLEREDLQTY